MSAPPASTPPSASSLYERLARSGLLYAIGIAAQRLSTFILVPVYTRVLPPAEIGYLWAIAAASGIATVVLALGLPEAVIRFGLRPGATHSRREAISSAVVAVTIASAGLALAIWLARGTIAGWILKAPAHGDLVGLAAVGVFFDVGALLPLAVMRADQKPLQHMSWSFARLAVSTLLTLVFVLALHAGVRGVLLANAITGGILYAAALPVLVPELTARPSASVLRSMLRFGLPLMAAALLAFGLDSSYVWVMAHVRGYEELSRYGVVYRGARIIHMLLNQPFGLAWTPVVWSVAGHAGEDRVYARSLTYAVAIVASAAMLSTLFRRELIELLGTEQCLPMAGAFAWVAFGVVFGAAGIVLSTGLLLKGRTELLTLTLGLGLVANLSLNVLWIPKLGYRGAAMSSFFSGAFVAVSTGWLSWRQRPIAYEWRRLAFVAAAIAAFTALGLSFERVHGPAGVLLRIAAVAAPLALLASPLFLHAGERAAISRALAHVRRFRFG